MSVKFRDPFAAVCGIWHELLGQGIDDEVQGFEDEVTNQRRRSTTHTPDKSFPRGVAFYRSSEKSRQGLNKK